MTRIAIVTGATGGMGRRIVRELARDHEVWAIGRDFSGWEDQPNVHQVEWDLRDPESGSFPQFPDQVDVLVHAAAIAEKRRMEDCDAAAYRRHLDINVVAPAALTRALLPALRTAEGTVIFINSGAGRNVAAGNAAYAASKHALWAVADTLRIEEPGMRVSTIAPGPTDTAMLAGLQVYDPAEVIDPEEIARAVRFVVDAGPTVQLTDVQVRPRIELALRRRSLSEG